MNTKDTVLRKIQKRGLKLTPQRIAIMKTLEGDTSHPGINEIYKRLKGDYPSLSMTTVYNTLEMLKDIGEVIELNLERNRSRFDPDTSMHDHILCVNCKKIKDLPASQNTLSEYNIKGFKVLGVSNQYYGICDQCLGAVHE